MKPVEMLMTEHRLMERMLSLLSAELDRIRVSGEPRIALILQGADFFKVYADRTHHGKEENILFRDLKKMMMPQELTTIMERLAEDHRIARDHVKDLSESAAVYESGSENAMGRIIDNLDFLVGFYPRHIELEDEHFFLPVQEILTQAERDAMLREFVDFDSRMIHEKYGQIVSELEKSESPSAGPRMVSEK